VRNEMGDTKRRTSSHPIKRLQAELKKIKSDNKVKNLDRSPDASIVNNSSTNSKTDAILEHTLSLDLDSLSYSELKKAAEVLRDIHNTTCRDYEKCSDVRDVLIQQQKALQDQLENIQEERDRFKDLYTSEMRQKYLSVSTIEQQKKQLEKNMYRSFEGRRSLSRPSTHARPMTQGRPRTSAHFKKSYHGKLLFE
jgi:Cu2+-containing amine oxidase